MVTGGISFCECRRRFAGAGGEDREEIARPGASNWIKCDAGGGVGHGAPDPFDDDLVRIGEQDARIWVDCGPRHLRRDVSERENAFGRR